MRGRLGIRRVAIVVQGWALACALAIVPAVQAQESPAQVYGALFDAVQMQRVFPDGKTFVDAVPKRPAAAIMAEYRRAQPRDVAALRAFVLANFDVPMAGPVAGPLPAAPAPAGATRDDVRAHVQALWPVLVRPPVTAAAGSALPVPEPFVVPGGRFREMYYWDSYFTMLGLAVDGRQALVESMLADFTDAVERYGHIPNGMRTYYLSRSQPPFFALMLDLSRDRDPVLAARRLAALRREHDFWMRGARAVMMPDGSVLNRYWDDRDTPRDESYAEDVATAKEGATAKQGKRPATQIYRDLRAGAESGWDFSSRWLVDPRVLASVRTSAIVPVDLNSLMLAMEERIATRCRAAADAACARRFDGLARARRQAIGRYLWVKRDGRFADWDMTAAAPTRIVSAAGLYPLFVGAASPAQARVVAAHVRRVLLAPGGVRTTTVRTGQQWDAPNGWAPLQWIAVEGLARYGEQALAREVAQRWMATVARTYAETGKMLEKYDIEERRAGGGGEYPLQDGFGWTNGVSSALLERYPGLAATDARNSLTARR
ncbi:MAG TPA: alpha,alpha-trehalase TreA [Sphingomonas sp.]|nr:alpha,alpha-trehalase TreA [Sphingomonas sp.]